MGVPVLGVPGSQVFTPDDQEVLGVVVLGPFGEIEGARDDHTRVDYHDVVVGDLMLGVDPGADTRVGEEVGGGVFLGPLALIEDHLDPHAPLVGVSGQIDDFHPIRVPSHWIFLELRQFP